MLIRATLCLLVWGAAAQAAPCRLALVLALDVSSSVDSREDALQRGGLAAALRSDRVERAFLQGGVPAALTVFEWSGRYNQRLLLDWTLIETPQDLADAADRVAASQRSRATQSTALGYALGYASALFDTAPPCDRQTVDISGDGPNNDGFTPRDTYRAFDYEEVTVNALVVAPDGGDASLVRYFENQVIRGRSAFVEIADGFADYERAITIKLVRELGAQVLGGLDSRDDIGIGGG